MPGVDPEHDRGYDQLRRDAPSSSPGLPPAGLRFGADKAAAYRTLYGFEAKSGSEAEIKQVVGLEGAARREHEAGLYAWVMEKAGIETVLANRIAMTPEMKAPLLRWASYVDALLFPLDSGASKALNPDRRALSGMAEDLRSSYLRDAGFQQVPGALDEYLEKVVRATLQKQKAAGALAAPLSSGFSRTVPHAVTGTSRSTTLRW